MNGSDTGLPALPRVAMTSRQRLTFAAHAWKAATQQHHRELLPLFRSLLPPDAVVFDVGAHAGQFAKLFARLVPEGAVYAFEPGRYARSVLMLALALNRVANVRVFPLALGAAAGVLDLRMPVKRSGSPGFGLSHIGADADADAGRRETVESIDVVTLDAFAALLPVARLDLIKADIEGWELQMLRGAAASLRRFRPLLWLEVVDPHLARAGDSRAALWQYLADQDYRPFAAGADGALAAVTAARDGDVLWLPAERADAYLVRGSNVRGTLASR